MRTTGPGKIIWPASKSPLSHKTHTTGITVSSWWPPRLQSSLSFLFTYFLSPPAPLMSPHLNVCFPARARLNLHCTIQTDARMPAVKSKASGPGRRMLLVQKFNITSLLIFQQGSAMAPEKVISIPASLNSITGVN